jgi:hypothetical protein
MRRECCLLSEASESEAGFISRETAARRRAVFVHMKTVSVADRIAEVLGIMMIGEGVVGALFPTRYSVFWSIGPKWMRKVATGLAQRPKTTRMICLAEVAAGLWIAAGELRRS